MCGLPPCVVPRNVDAGGPVPAAVVPEVSLAVSLEAVETEEGILHPILRSPR